MIGDDRFASALALALRVLSAAVLGATAGASAGCVGEPCEGLVAEVAAVFGERIGEIAATGLALGDDGRLIAIGDAGVILREQEGPWQALASGTTEDLHAITLVGRIGLIVGDGGVILRSDDGGERWTPVDSGTGEALRDVQLLAGGVAVAVGGEAILRSPDGGVTWAPAQSVPEGPHDLVALSPGQGGDHPSAHVVAYGRAGTSLLSEDGDTWTQVTIGVPGIVDAAEGTRLAITDDGALALVVYDCDLSVVMIDADATAIDPGGLWIGDAHGGIHAVVSGHESPASECESPILEASAAPAHRSPIRAIRSIDDARAVAITADGFRVDVTLSRPPYPVGCAYYEGRPLWIDDAPRVAPIVAADGWIPKGAIRPINIVLWPAARHALAAAFARAGAEEHASVAAFARVILHLLALAAPSSLIADTRAALADEVEHARRCFTVASALAGRPLGPGPLAIDGALDESPELGRFAVAAFLEGCVGETIAAAVARVAAETCTVPAIREHVAAIADDEVRHAALAWRSVAWALEAGGAPVREALARALAGLPPGLSGPSGGPGAAGEACPPGHGFVTADERRAIAAALLREVIVPRARALIYGDAEAARSPCERAS